MKFSAMLIFMAAWVTLVYAPICHMVWSGGWIAGLGALDFAGGTVVHINAGIAGLVACLVLGPRRGYGTMAMPPHNLTFTLIGAALLWVGWFGFNAGSAVAANGSAGLAMVNTQVATAAAALGWMLVEWAGKGRPSILGMASGAVAGLVAVTPACGASGPMGAMLIGLVSGVVCYWAVTSLKAKLRYDDSLDAFGVHGVGGIVGALGVAITCAPQLGGQGFGAGNDGIGEQFVTQAITVVFTLVYSGIATYVLLKVAGLFTGGIRVTDEEETEGLDIASHGERAYS
jgi:Amt family ammonium transporter